MKHILIILLTILSFASFGQKFLENSPPQSPTVERINQAMTGSYVATGTDTYAVSYSNGVYTYTAITGLGISVTFTNPNTGASTLNFDGLGSRNILKWSSGSLVSVSAGDLIGTIKVRYDGTQFVMEGSYGSGSASSLFPTTGTGTATGNVTGDLDGNDFEISNADAVTVTGSGTMRLESGGELGLYRTGNSVRLNTGGSVSIFTGTVSSTEKLTVGVDGEILVSTDAGTSGQVLTSGGSGAPASWEDPTSGTITTNTILNTGTNNTEIVSPLAFTTSKHPLESVSVTTTGGTITIDFDLGSADDAVQKVFIGSNTWATSKTLAFSNATNSIVFNFHFEVTNVAGTIICTTCIAAASAVSGTWDSGTDTWTPTETGKYEMGGTWDGSAWKIKIIGPFE